MSTPPPLPHNKPPRLSRWRWALFGGVAIVAVLWTVYIVKQTATGFYIARGYAKWTQGDNGGAVGDDDKAIALNPKNAGAYNSRGLAKQAKGDYAGAVADYDQVILLDKSEPHEYTRFQRHLLIARLGRGDDDLNQQVEGWKAGWPKTVGLFLIGKIDEKEFFRLAGDTKNTQTANVQACEANYYSGMMDVLRGHHPQASDKFLACVATGASTFIEYALSKAELARLD